MKFATFFLTLVFSLTAQATLHEEVDINADVAGTFTPAKGKSCGRVLMLHGFQDHRDGVGNLKKMLAEELSALGIESLRFDFRGEGERNGYRVTSTINSRIEDSERSFEFLTKDSKLPTGVLGFSLGGLTAMLLAAKHPDWFDTMVVWSAAGDGRSNLVSDDPSTNKMIREAVEEGEATITTWTTMTYTREYILSYLGVNVMDTLASYPGSFLSIRGENDFLPPNEKNWIQALPNQDASYLTLKGADHIFNVLEPGNSKYKQVISETANWYQSRLCGG